jgi:hypothetical protein
MTLSNYNNLGQLLGEFGWDKGRAKHTLFIWIVWFFLSLFFSLFLIGLPLLIMSIYYIYQSYTQLIATKPVILVYEHGLIDSRKGSLQVIRYDQIKNIYISVVMNNYVVTLETHKQKKIKINEYVANIDHVRILLEQQIIRQQLPDLIALYQQGNSIVFDNIQVSQAGLMGGKRTLPWSKFGTADIQRLHKSVYLMIFSKDSSKEWVFIMRRNTFPNIALFLALVNYAQETQVAM